MMDPIVCPKCGSSRVDQGQNYLVSLVGLALAAISLVLIMHGVLVNSMVSWALEHPHSFDCPAESISLIIGFYLCFEGIRPTRQIRCRECGITWQQAEHRHS